MALKYSRQRQAVWDFIKERKDHPTASVVYEGVRQVFPNISLGTVYRNLMLLKDMGRLATIEIGDNAIHFDPNIMDHEHFVCRRCGSLVDLDTYDLKAVKMKLGDAAADREIDTYSTIYYGICRNCLATGNEKAKAGKEQKA